MKILVAFAGKHGATEEIAESITKTLNKAELSVDIMPVSRIKNVGDYEAVILGSSIYMGKWHKDIVRFLKMNQQELADSKIWLFSSGPTGSGDARELLKGWTFPEKLKPVLDAIQPEDVAVFHGKLLLSELSGFERWIIKKVKAETGDFRDWQLITSWTDAIAQVLAA